MNDIVMILYYAMTAFFAVCLALNFTRTRNAQKALLYLVVLMPFVMRLIRLK
jgi:hypothetical protein